MCQQCRVRVSSHGSCLHIHRIADATRSDVFVGVSNTLITLSG